MGGKSTWVNYNETSQEEEEIKTSKERHGKVFGIRGYPAPGRVSYKSRGSGIMCVCEIYIRMPVGHSKEVCTVGIRAKAYVSRIVHCLCKDTEEKAD